MTARDDIEAYILRLPHGDHAAFASLYSATSAKLYGVCLSILGDRAEADETLQEVYMRVWHSADRYAANGLSPMTWLITIARNRSIDRLRARRADAPASLDDVAEPATGRDADPEAAAMARDEMRRVVDCLAELPKDRADAVLGAYLRGHSYKDLARHHGVPLNTIRTWLRRSLIALRECLA